MNLELKVTVRPVPTKAINQTRSKGQIPAELYGHGVKNQHLFLDLKKFEKVYEQAGSSTLLNLVIDQKPPLKVIIGEIQREPVSSAILHIDLHQVRMDEEIQAKIPLVFIGESKAVKELGGTLIKPLEELEVTCLPNDLVHEVEVNLEVLDVLDKAIHVKDLLIPPKIKVLNNVNDVVALVKAQVVEEPIAPAKEAVPAAEAPVQEGEVAGEVKTEVGEIQEKSGKHGEK